MEEQARLRAETTPPLGSTARHLASKSIRLKTALSTCERGLRDYEEVVASSPRDDNACHDSTMTSVAKRTNPALVGGMSMAIGSLPHRSFRDAFELSMNGTDIATVPSLPLRAPAESLIAQALVGIQGVTAGPYGSIGIDAPQLDPGAYVSTDLDDESFASFRRFLKYAKGHTGTVKWQFVGPVTLGAALQRAGVSANIAYAVALRAVQQHTDYLAREVARSLPKCQQIVVLDEPDFGAIADPEFVLPPDAAIDLLSGALAVLEPMAIAGVHCCGDADLASILAAGPTLLSVPAAAGLIESAGYIQRFVDNGGWIAWGAIATDGPIPHSAERPWRQLCELWCQMVQRGCDAARLRQQSLISPGCGLSGHSVAAAEAILELTRQLSARVKDQSSATRFALGA